MYQEKKKALMQQYDDSKNTSKMSKERLITATRNSTENLKINRTTNRKEKCEEKQ